MLLQKNRIPLKTSSCGMFLENNIFLLISHEPLFEGGESGDVKRSWLAPKGQRLCEPYQNLDGESQLSESTTSPCQRLARGLGSGLKPLLMKKGLGLMEDCRLACNGAWGFPPQGNALMKRSLGPHPKIKFFKSIKLFY